MCLLACAGAGYFIAPICASGEGKDGDHLRAIGMRRGQLAQMVTAKSARSTSPSGAAHALPHQAIHPRGAGEARGVPSRARREYADAALALGRRLGIAPLVAHNTAWPRASTRFQPAFNTDARTCSHRGKRRRSRARNRLRRTPARRYLP
jgi:hypothetical protein